MLFRSKTAAKEGTTSSFYAVAHGWFPGVYTSWDEAKPQTVGTATIHKGFVTLADAQAYVAENFVGTPLVPSGGLPAPKAAQRAAALAAFNAAKAGGRFAPPPTGTTPRPAPLRPATGAAAGGRGGSDL